LRIFTGFYRPGREPTSAKRAMIVAIDGPAGAGKSTVARAAADAVGFTYLDTGAMYRSAALALLRDPSADPGEMRIVVGDRVELDGEDVTEAIRAPEVSEAASRVAADPRVRTAMVERQRALMGSGDWVAEGRDIGTVVAPDAELKIFLTADPSERARRRAAQTGRLLDDVLAEQAARDARDSGREASPLAAAEDAVVIDTSAVGQDEVVAHIVRLVRVRQALSMTDSTTPRAG
jgi:cytidylate kinase